MRVCPQIFRSELVISFEAILQVGKQFLGAKAGPFLYSDGMSAEQRKVNRHHKLASRVAFCNQIEAVPTRVLQLIKSEVAKFHSITTVVAGADARHRRASLPAHYRLRAGPVNID